MHFAVGEFRVEIIYHGEHHAGRNLHRFIIAGPVGRDVAIVAHHAEAGNGEPHVRHISFGRQNLEVLRWCLGAASAAGTAAASCGRGILGEKGCGANREYKE